MENHSPVRAEPAVQLQTTETRKRLFSATPLKTLSKTKHAGERESLFLLFPGMLGTQTANQTQCETSRLNTQEREDGSDLCRTNN